MAASQPTPCSEFFGLMKKRGKISYKDMAKMILSGRPLSDGQSPASRVNDRSWVSRFVVHAPVGAIQDSYFCSFSISAPRIVARLKSKKGKAFTSAEILDLICGEDAEPIIQALALAHQNISLYRNTLYRIVNENGFNEDERAEIAMVLFVAAACTGNVRYAVECAVDFSKSTHGSGMTTPMITPNYPDGTEGSSASRPMKTTIGLLRMTDGFIVGDTHWIDPDARETEIGAMALDEGSISDVGVDVSAHHAVITHEDDGWYIKDLNSSNGTYLINGVNGDRVDVGRKSSDASGSTSGKVAIHPGDEIHLGSSTGFLVVEGAPGL